MCVCVCGWGRVVLGFLSPRVLAVSHMYPSSKVMWLHWKLLIILLFISFGSWSLDLMRICLIVVLPLKYVCIQCLPQMCLKLSAGPFV